MLKQLITIIITITLLAGCATPEKKVKREKRDPPIIVYGRDEIVIEFRK